MTDAINLHNKKAGTFLRYLPNSFIPVDFYYCTVTVTDLANLPPYER